MGTTIKRWILTLAAGLSMVIQGQNLPDNICRIEGDKIIYRINTGWGVQELSELARNFHLDSLLIQNIHKGINTFMTDSLGWQINYLDQGWLEIVQPINNSDTTLLNIFSDFFLVGQDLFGSSSKQAIAAEFGFNRLDNPMLLKQDGDLITITLTGFDDAKEVFLTGSFNQWATNDLVMTKKDGSWQKTMNLKPGKYLYKFIVDGNWKEDPNNLQVEQDGDYNRNNVFYVCNTRFTLNGYEKAKKVWLAGSFNDFRPNELPMTYDPDSAMWTLDVYLREGTWYYKFIVDREWILDPANPDARNDGKGNQNSVLGVGTPHPFFLQGFQEASSIMLAGSFNNWNPREIAMTKGARGWTGAYILRPGMYTYKYIVDGKWIPDPDNPYTSGTGQYVNSVLVLEPNYTFNLQGYDNAREVLVTGTFCNWSHDGYRMQKTGGGWRFPAHLETGKHSYKFIVDGQWILDPDNELWEENQYGTDNSVLWIE